ncbi:MAG: hypothetical protein ABJH05_02980 [Fulvivirga sp.]
MRLFLHIIISEKAPLFNSKWSTWVKAQLNDVKYFDVDRQSDVVVVETALKAIEQAEQLFVYIDCDQSTPGHLFKVIKKLSAMEGCMIYCKGENSMLQKLSKVFGSRWQGALSDEVIEQGAKNYFKALG